MCHVLCVIYFTSCMMLNCAEVCKKQVPGTSGFLRLKASCNLAFKDLQIKAEWLLYSCRWGQSLPGFDVALWTRASLMCFSMGFHRHAECVLSAAVMHHIIVLLTAVLKCIIVREQQSRHLCALNESARNECRSRECIM